MFNLGGGVELSFEAEQQNFTDKLFQASISHNWGSAKTRENKRSCRSFKGELTEFLQV